MTRMELFLNLFLLHANTSLRVSFHSSVTNFSDVPPSRKKFYFKKPFARLCLRFMLGSTRSAVVTLTLKSRRYRRRRCWLRRCSGHGFSTVAAAIVTVVRARSCRSYTGHFESPQTVGRSDATNFGGALPFDRPGQPLPDSAVDGKGGRSSFFKPTDRRNNAAVECTLGRPALIVRKATDGARADERTRRTSERRRVRVNDERSYQRGVRARTRQR